MDSVSRDALEKAVGGKRVIVVCGNRRQCRLAFEAYGDELRHMGRDFKMRRLGTNPRIYIGTGRVDFIFNSSRHAGRGMSADFITLYGTGRIADTIKPILIFAEII